MNEAGIRLLKDFEGFERKVGPGVAEAYWDHLGKVWTGPYGFTKDVRKGDRWTQAEADARLGQEVLEYEAAVFRACQTEPNENQLAAMTCLAWNIGVAGFEKSTVLKCHNRGDFSAASRAFGLWNRAGGREVSGLTRRRAAEAALYLQPVDGWNLQMPQRVDPESGARHSPTIWGASVGTGAGALGLLSETSRTIGDLRWSLGDWFPYVLLALVLVGGAWAVWSRIRQRRSGWA